MFQLGSVLVHLLPWDLIASWNHSHLSGAVASAVEAAAQRASARAHDSADVDLCLADSLQKAGVASKGKEAA